MRRFALLTITMALVTGLFALGCGGGGGSSESVTYEGSTMPAVIDTTGSVELAKMAAMAGNDASDLVDSANPTSVDIESIPGNPFEVVAYAKGIFSGGGLSSTRHTNTPIAPSRNTTPMSVNPRRRVVQSMDCVAADRCIRSTVLSAAYM